MKNSKSLRNVRSGHRSAVEKALLDEGPMGYVAFIGVILIWGLELFLNLRQGSGWTYWAHLLLVGPLWIFVLSYFVYALSRKLLRPGSRYGDGRHILGTIRHSRRQR